MKQMNVFLTKDMPKNIWTAVYEEDMWIEDGYFGYTVGYFMIEGSKEPEQYGVSSIENWTLIDKWLLKQGAKDGETVLIEH